MLCPASFQVDQDPGEDKKKSSKEASALAQSAVVRYVEINEMQEQREREKQKDSELDQESMQLAQEIEFEKMEKEHGGSLELVFWSLLDKLDTRILALSLIDELLYLAVDDQHGRDVLDGHSLRGLVDKEYTLEKHHEGCDGLADVDNHGNCRDNRDNHDNQEGQAGLVDLGGLDDHEVHQDSHDNRTNIPPPILLPLPRAYLKN